MAGVAQEADVGADVVAAGAAEFAVVAVEGRFERGAVPGRPAGDAGAHRHHRAGRLVPQHHGVVAGRIADGAFRIGVQVGAADAHGIHPHLHFARTGRSDFLLRQAEFARRGEFGNEHFSMYAAVADRGALS